MKNFITKAKEKVPASASRAYAGILAAVTAFTMAVPAYAEMNVTEDNITNLLGTVFDIAFTLIAAAIALKGSFMLVPAVQSYLDGVSSQSGDQKREAGTNIGIAIATLMLAGMIFMIKDPIQNAFGINSSSS